jgi:excisionase family DNA binding protein
VDEGDARVVIAVVTGWRQWDPVTPGGGSRRSQLEVGTLTTAEAAERVGVAPATVRWWVARGYLAPIRAGAKPLRFREEDVWRCARDRMRASEVERLDELWQQLTANA